MNTKEILNTMLETLYVNNPEVLYHEYRENEGSESYERFKNLEDLDEDYLMELFTDSFEDQQILDMYIDHIGEDYTCELYYKSFHYDGYEEESLEEFQYDEYDIYGDVSMHEDDDDTYLSWLYHDS